MQNTTGGIIQRKNRPMICQPSVRDTIETEERYIHNGRIMQKLQYEKSTIIPLVLAPFPFSLHFSPQ